MSIRIYLTGRVAFEADEKFVIDERQFRGRQGRLAFAYLVSHRIRPVPREELASVVWLAEPAANWEVALSSLISRLRSLVSVDSLAARGVSLSGGFGQYQLLLPPDSWVDVDAVGTAVDEAEGALRTGESGRVLGPATVGANIARRPFLSGVEGEWVEAQRQRLERQLIRALDCLSEMWLLTGEPSLAIETATETVTRDPLRERSYQLLMRAHMSGGNRAEAVRVYHRVREHLAEELGTDPAAETERIYLQLLD